MAEDRGGATWAAARPISRCGVPRPFEDLEDLEDTGSASAAPDPLRGQGGDAAGVGRAVGIDLGSRRIGVAVSGTGGSMAFPRPYIERHKDRARDHEAIAEVVDGVGAEVVVVGLPLSLDGTRGPAAIAAGEEAAALAALFRPRGVRVETFDERLTTVSAEAALGDAGATGRQRRVRVDSAAAAVLLQSWLDAR